MIKPILSQQRFVIHSHYRFLAIAVVSSFCGVSFCVSAFANEAASQKVETKAFDLTVPEGWAVQVMKLPNKGTGRLLEHKESKIRVFVQQMAFEKVPKEEVEKHQVTPGLTSSSLVLPIILKAAKKDKSAKPVLVFDRIHFGGKSEGAARAVVTFPEKGTYATVHGVIAMRGKNGFMAVIIYEGKVDHVNSSQLHHTQLNNAYDMISNVKFK